MELCKTAALSTSMPQHLLIPNYQFKTSAPPKANSFPLMNKGVVAYPRKLLKATTTTETGKPTGENSNGVVVVEDVPPVVKDECDETMKVEPPEEHPPTDEQIDLFGEFFNKFNIKVILPL
ncbi:hypothetical protein Nepgr_016509 [Nepenthes gracilis]|uniref:Uncharacterized protein n=1 Tax=Nepenthes gracilis TaxID=150966 RepID=A0AAD3XRP5_NEPGR|nr:hypothetical protein Nepgr_016509 [Nepenthes gracilis]